MIEPPWTVTSLRFALRKLRSLEPLTSRALWINSSAAANFGMDLGKLNARPGETRLGVRTLCGWVSQQDVVVGWRSNYDMWTDTRIRAPCSDSRLPRHSRIRCWATFGLGSLLDVDGERVGRALGRRLDDPEGDAAGEALIGLARRRDRSIRAKVRALLETENVGTLIVEAAGQLADSSLVPSLEPLKGSGWAKDDPPGWLLDEALTACREGRPLER
jgi:hypothetical protein